MLDILVYLFENYHTPHACPQAQELVDTLTDAGFEHDDISDALLWLNDMHETIEQCKPLDQAVHSGGHRVFTPEEYEVLGTQAIGFLMYLEQSKAITPVMREVIIEQSQLLDESPVSPATIRLISLMTLWSQETPVPRWIYEELMTLPNETLQH